VTFAAQCGSTLIVLTGASAGVVIPYRVFTCSIMELCVQRVQCGDLYTVAATADGELIFWGFHSTVSSRSSAPLHGSDEDSSYYDTGCPSNLRLEQPSPNGDLPDHSFVVLRQSVPTI
jgi:hypothetical protein